MSDLHGVQGSLAIMNIPRQQNCFHIAVLKPLWKWLPSSQKAELRQICKAFKREIDSNIGCEIYIDDKKFCLIEGLAPPSSTINLVHLSPIYNIKMLLSHPQLITNVNLEGPINSDNLLQLLKICQNLKRLHLGLDFNITTKTSCERVVETPVLIALKDLQILHEFNKTKIEPPETTWQNIEYILSRIDMPNLESLKIENFFDCPKEFEKSVDTLSQFIVKYRHSLKHLHLTLRKQENCPHQHSSTHPNLNLIKISEDKLKALDFKTIVIHCDKPFHQAMDSVLAGATLLSRLEYDKPWASWFLYSPIILTNSKTLRCVKISNAAPMLNLSSFALCSNLQVLHIVKDLSGDMKPTPNIYNFATLPKNIQELKMKNYSVDSVALLSIRRLKTLRSLHLEFLGSHSAHNTGITANIVMSILTRYRKLDELFIEEIQTDNTRLNDVHDIISQVNMVSSTTERRFGFESWTVVIAPIKTIEVWKPRLRCILDE